MTATVTPLPMKFSPTQLSVFKSCRRKWHFQWVLGFKPPQSKSQVIGSAIHKEIEVALTNGTVPEDPRAAAALKELARIDAAGEPGLEARLSAVVADPENFAKVIAIDVADEGSRVALERPIEIALSPSPIDGAPRSFHGVIDLYDGRRKRAEITDHKTTSDLKYGKTSYELAEDVQMISYAYWALSQPEHIWENEKDTVIVRHLLIPTRGRATAVPVEAELTREHVEAKWQTFLPIIDEMDLTRRARQSADVPADGYTNGECERFGGCPHKARCASAIFGAENFTMSNEVQNRIASLRAKLGGTAPAPTPQVQAPAPVAQPQAPAVQAQAPAAPAAGGAGMAKLKALQAARAGGAAPAAPAPAEPVVDIQAKISELQRMGKPAQAPQPVEAPLPPLLTVDIPGPTFAEGDAAAIAAAMKAQVTQVTQTGARVAVLYLDCAPTRGVNAERLEVVLAPILETIKQSTGTSWQHHDYRHGPGLVVDGIATLALPAHLVIDTSTPLGKVALEALIPRADVIVTGRAA